MFYLIVFAAAALFITHVVLLLTAFPKSALATTRYFYSHLTLWLTGILIFVLAQLYSGSGNSAFLDFFNTPLKKGSILIFTFALSLVAHLIVKFVVLPMLRKQVNHTY